MNKRAIIHVENTDNLSDFARYLVSSGWTLISANRTEEFLKKEKIPVTREPALVENNQYILETNQLIQSVLETTVPDGEDEIKNDSADENDGSNIYLVCINLNPVTKKINSEQDLNDVEKPVDYYYSMLITNAVYNFKNVLVLTDPADYKEIMIQLRVGFIKPEYRAYLAAKAMNLLSAYYASLSNSLLRSPLFNEPFSRYFTGNYKKYLSLHNGANEQQKGALYTTDIYGFDVTQVEKIQGKELTYNNISDMSFAWEQISCLFTSLKNQMTVKSINSEGYEFTTQFTPVVGTVFTVAVKNRMIVGAAVATNVQDSFLRSYSYDTENIKGVTIACSSVVNGEAAKEMVKGDFELIVAPGFTTDARQILAANRNIRLVPSARVVLSDTDIHPVIGGILVQTKENILFEKWNVKTKNRPSQFKTDEMAFGMMIVMNSRSNSAVLIKQNSVIGLSQACTSPVKAIKTVLEEAKEYVVRHPETENPDIANTLADILVSDSPIPFCDETRELIENGVTAIIQPGGTVDDDEFIKYCDERGIVMVFTGMSHISF